MIAAYPLLLSPLAIAGAVCLNELNVGAIPRPRIPLPPTPWQLATHMHVPAPDRQWGPARIEPGERLACSLTGESYHPIVQALARPDCKAERLRRPPAILAQILMDLTVGTCLLGVCLVLGALGASNQIGALIAERSLLFAGTALFYGLILTSFGIGAVVTGLIRLLVG